MKRSIHIIFIILAFSCAKENDPFKSISFENPIPPDRATDISLRYVNVYFDKIISRTNIPIFFTPDKAYFDTINPPVKVANITPKSNFVIRPSTLQPGKTYYWAYLVDNLAGRIQSEVYSFSTATFDGEWELYSISNGVSDNTDSLIIEGEDIYELQISGSWAKIKTYSKDDMIFIDATFTYNETISEIIFSEIQTGKKYEFGLYNLGYDKFYRNVILKLRNVQGKVKQFIYKRRKK